MDPNPNANPNPNGQGVEVQDRAFHLATQHFHYPKIPLVSLRSSKVAPVAYRSSQVQGTPVAYRS